MLIKTALFLAQIVLGLVIIGLLLWWLQPRMIFFPTEPLHATPADWGLDYEDIRFNTDDGVRLQGWLIRAPTRAPAKRLSRPSTVLLLHGNAGNISHRRDSVAILAALGLDVFIID
ncbi:MAG: alpha/beta hydrolase, partial [Gammaproteobacteria bacterium]|nr:alpha/beta hydrolase [Gammaproteobacteria bacterium]